MDSYLSTIGVDFCSPLFQHKDTIFKFQIWDTAGLERFRVITQAYYRGAHTVCLIYSVGDMDSFKLLPTLYADLKKFGYVRFVIVVANCIDLPSQQHQVTREEGQAFAMLHNASFVEVSAKTQKGLHTLKKYLVKAALEYPSRIEIKAD